jgi:hypothetical protein
VKEKRGSEVDYAKQMLLEQRESESKARAAEIVAHVRQLHVDELSPGTMVSFVKRYSGDQEYTFLALKVVSEKLGGQRWYITNRDGARTNEQLEELLAEKLGFESFQRLVPAPKPLHASTWVGPEDVSLYMPSPVDRSSDPNEELS